MGSFKHLLSLTSDQGGVGGKSNGKLISNQVTEEGCACAKAGIADLF